MLKSGAAILGNHSLREGESCNVVSPNGDSDELDWIKIEVRLLELTGTKNLRFGALSRINQAYFLGQRIAVIQNRT
ncbi:hypothetical protein TNIN_439191 [Trichonephila inaurata madagascariensis]|uniref:Uncharacterized protein n=1 Tax=Trichonephila inaurata madagascariensis TaxID=2747483 RepID=A0A8X7CNQ5_9ARAC|nr:hypothetical protein TNIN_439191 [Trichonephila inaurata madagascariensis]